MTTLITGAAGFLGSALVEHFRERGVPVCGTGRNPKPGLIAVGEIDGSSNWRQALRRVQTVVHCAGIAHSKAQPADYQRVNVDGTMNLARQAVEAGVSRFIFISSIGVNGGETWDRTFTAKDPPNPQKPYASSKLAAERGLQKLAAETGFEVIIIRPPLIVGPGAKGNIALLAKLVRLGIPTPFGLTRNRRDVVSFPVLCSLIEKCTTAPVQGQTFLVSDGRALSVRELIDWVAAINGCKAPIHLPVPLGFLKLALTLAGLGALRSQLLGDIEIDAEPARRLIGAPEPPRAAP